MEPTDTTYLVRGAKSGDADSLAGLVARFTPLLEMQARHRLAAVAPDVDPADCVQETWLRA
ncbi:MAG: hypothetical protein KDC87_12100, partial [Planctomycetes bacterium]|nr:hypothetical protein [Planctomycetota bacterium]